MRITPREHAALVGPWVKQKVNAKDTLTAVYAQMCIYGDLPKLICSQT